MRLWHTELIPLLSNQRLVGQHRECCALRGRGWGKQHSTVDYVFTHTMSMLVMYHYDVMEEMVIRGFNVEPLWYEPNYRGKIIGFAHNDNIIIRQEDYSGMYPEHDEEYLRECATLLVDREDFLLHHKYWESEIRENVLRGVIE